jgi:hypothetical protein
LQVSAGDHRLQRLVERVERDELARLEGRAVHEIDRKRFGVGALVPRPLHGA